MTTKLAEVADGICMDFQREKAVRSYSIEAIRDFCDLRTGSDLDTVQLDILTDLVKTRIEQDGIEVRL